MQKPDTYRVVREYGGQYGAEEMLRRIIRSHLREDWKENAEPEGAACRTDEYDT